ncbi:putative uncharacterized protein [Ruminococcus sp. CAG:563]|nr:putative uncharacterized protein [Ruminococcus sp. CAG:563]HJI47566.1 M23 family metallopeptidase [Oscillospiraceae bacterium]
MDEAVVKPKDDFEQTETVEKKKNSTNSVMIVQLVVCIFAVVSVFLIGRLSPQTFEFIRDEYNRIMSVDMDAKEIASSAKKVIERAEATDEGQTAEKSTERKNVNTVKSAADGEVMAVMSLFKSDEEITVPVHGEITSEYGNRTNPVSGEYLMHSGVDIAASQGTEIRAAYSGIVSEVGSNSVGGNYISLVHKDGSETLYCHCSKIIAEKGDVIRAGETIALVGSTGRSTGPHLHFEITVDGKTENPLLYLPNENGEV